MADLALVLGTALVLLAAAAALAIAAGNRRRDRADAAARIDALQEPDVEQLLARTAALAPPDELPQARNLTKAEKRRMRGRQHPNAHKRDGRSW